MVGEGRGVHPRTPNSYLSRSRIVCYACLHIWPGFSVSTSPVLSHLHPREHPILPFRCNRTRLRMSKLTSHPPSNGNACRRGLKIRIIFRWREKVVSCTRTILYSVCRVCSSCPALNGRFRRRWKILRNNVVIKSINRYIYSITSSL